MLEIRNVHAYNEAGERLRRRYYNWVSANAEESRKTDTLTEFTFRTHAMLDSSANLENLLELGSTTGVSLLVFKPRTVQFVAASDAVTAAWHTVFSESQLQEWEQTLATRSHNSYYSTFATWRDNADRGSASSITHHQAPFGVKEHAGVYDCATGDRITDRRAVIQRVWDLGFACSRGRPLTVARTKWSGSREDLVRAEEIFNEFYTRRYTSDSARKLCQVYASASRHYAWPGTW
jgi:hypothetical protein